MYNRGLEYISFPQTPTPKYVFMAPQSHEHIQSVMVGAVISSSSIYGHGEQNRLMNYTGHRGRCGTAEMWNGVKDSTGSSKKRKKKKAKSSQTDSRSTLAKPSPLLLSPHN